MKIEKAIEILSDHVLWCDEVKEVDTFDALKLGIEALKRIKARRDLKTGWEITPLPGETEE